MLLKTYKTVNKLIKSNGLNRLNSGDKESGYGQNKSNHNEGENIQGHNYLPVPAYWHITHVVIPWIKCYNFKIILNGAKSDRYLIP